MAGKLFLALSAYSHFHGSKLRSRFNIELRNNFKTIKHYYHNIKAFGVIDFLSSFFPVKTSKLFLHCI